MLKKLSILTAFFFAAALPMAPPALAWDEVCFSPTLRGLLSPSFKIAYGFEPIDGQLPSSHIGRDGELRSLPDFGRYAPPRNDGVAAGVIHSPRPSHPRATVCVNLDPIPDGAPFFVYMRPRPDTRSFQLCKIQRGNAWHTQQTTNRGQLAYHWTGHAFDSGCFER